MNPYEHETELENSFHADVYFHMEDHAVTEEEARKAIAELDCYKEAFGLKKVEYLAMVSGKAMEVIAKELGISAGAYWFDTEEERSAFLLQLAPYHKQGLGVIRREGLNVRFRTVAMMEFRYQEKSYFAERDYGYGYDMDKARFDLEIGTASCDCIRCTLIQEQTPTFGFLKCGETIELVNLVIELKPGVPHEV